MLNYPIRTITAMLALAVSLAGALCAQDEAKTEPAKPTRAELRDKQLDVSLEAREIERILLKLKRASELSKTRIAEAAQTAESVSTALDRGDSAEACKDAQQAAEMFREIAKQLAALLAEETPQRIAEARNLANQLAMTERQFAQQFQGMLNPTQSGGKGKVDPRSQSKPDKPGENGENNGQNAASKNAPAPSRNGLAAKDPKKTAGEENNSGGGKPEANDKQQGAANGGKPGDNQNPQETPGGGGKEESEEPRQGPGAGGAQDKTEPAKNEGGGGGAMTEADRREALAARADQLAQTGKTLEDILNSVLQSADPADKQAVARLEAALKETDLLKAIEAMQQAANTIRDNKLDDARLGALDIADRMEIAAQRLDAAYRTIVAPQAEELRKLEQQLAGLREKLDQLETPSQIAAWHREARELLDKMDKLSISEKVRDEFLEEMKKAGLGVDGDRSNFDWALVNDRYVAPAGYATRLLRVQEEVQARIQTLLLGDITASADEATPPKYQDLVERYYQVLSGDSGTKQSERQKPGAGKTPKE